MAWTYHTQWHKSWLSIAVAPGGQSQFSALLDMEPESNRIWSVLTDMWENIVRTLSTESLATIAYLSLREFGRAFFAETGETPAKAVEPFEQKLPGHGSSAERSQSKSLPVVQARGS